MMKQNPLVMIPGPTPVAEPIRQALAALSGLCGLLFCVLLVVYGLDMVKSEMAMNMRTAALGWPEWVFGLFIPAGAFLMGLEFINYIVFAFKKDLLTGGL